MPTFEKADTDTKVMAAKLIEEFHPLAHAAGLRVDIVMAYGDRDDASGELLNDALTHQGVKALGVAKKIGTKDRVKGMGDAEITLDGDHWEDCTEDQKRALLDHELHHLVVTDKLDDLGRPVVKLRKHDVQIGWFNVIAVRHGGASIERQQAATMMAIGGQYYWPEITAATDSRGAKLELKEVKRQTV